MRIGILWLGVAVALAGGCTDDAPAGDDDDLPTDDDAADDDTADDDTADDDTADDDTADDDTADDDTADDDAADDDAADDDTADDDTAPPDDDTAPPDDDTADDDTAPPDDDTADDDTDPPPPTSCVSRPPPVHDPLSTPVIHLHGWILDGAGAEEAYGHDTGGGPHADGVRLYTGFPNGTVDPYAPNQVVGSHYYGTLPPEWYTADDAAEVEALSGIPRYALIVAKQARNLLGRVPTATGIAFTCESMGCEVMRYLLENDVDGLVSDGLPTRWVTYAGVVAGAAMAEPGYLLAEYADLIGLDLVDVDHMSYDWYESNVAACDHVRTEGNNPAFGGMVVHHVVADRPTFEDAFGLPLLDLVNPESWPNDGILFSDDQWFHAMAPDARLPTPSGELLASSRSYAWTDHFATRDSDGAHAAGAAALVGSRRFTVVLESIELLDDRERDDALDLEETGEPPAEVVVETEVRWPWLGEVFGRDPVVDVRRMSHRVVPVYAMEEGATLSPGEAIVDGPVFDEMTSIRLALKALEADWYATHDVFENLFDADESLGEGTLDLPIADGTVTVELERARLTLSTRVRALY
ncbi:hypothetical protein L6R50_11430 [Myxococcota bacterium]|nr:hypothetical protein [Myxococcota bacterium]